MSKENTMSVQWTDRQIYDICMVLTAYIGRPFRAYGNDHILVGVLPHAPVLTNGPKVDNIDGFIRPIIGANIDSGKIKLSYFFLEEIKMYLKDLKTIEYDLIMNPTDYKWTVFKDHEHAVKRIVNGIDGSVISNRDFDFLVGRGFFVPRFGIDLFDIGLCVKKDASGKSDQLFTRDMVNIYKLTGNFIPEEFYEMDVVEKDLVFDISEDLDEDGEVVFDF